MRMIETHLLMYALTWPVLISTIYLSILSIMSSISIRWSSATLPTWSAYGGGLVAVATTLLHLKSDFALLLIRFSAGMLRVCARAEKGLWV